MMDRLHLFTATTVAVALPFSSLPSSALYSSSFPLRLSTDRTYRDGDTLPSPLFTPVT